ncbi:MAG: DUF4830 domain-containing protein [Faecalibacterium sp.]|nr:DUF4830 domain-containing protein [Faecalibacterium sp.]
MFMITLGKTGLRRLGVLAACAVVLVGAAAAGRLLGGQAVTAAASAGTKIESTQDIAAYFTGFGLQVDTAGITADKVKIPRKWDDSFAAFNTLIGQSGLDLKKYRGKTVEKWLAPVPAKSTGETETYAVLLVYKQKAVGAYLLEKPGGAVTGLTDAANQQAALDAASQAAAAADDGTLHVTVNAEPMPGADGYPVE